MSKEHRAFLSGLLLPLVLAAAGLINAHAKRVEAETAAHEARAAKFALADDFQDYVEYVMEQRGCEP